MPIESYAGRIPQAREKAGPLVDRYNKFHLSAEVRGAVRVAGGRGIEVSGDPSVRIATYLDLMAERFQNPKYREALIEHSITRSRNLDHRVKDEVQNKQRESLTTWGEHLADADYPSWFKYFVFRSVVQLADPDYTKKSFRPRGPYTTYTFPEFNAEALGRVYTFMQEEAGKSAANEPTSLGKGVFELGSSFQRMYYAALTESETVLNPQVRAITSGEWRVVRRGVEEALEDRGRDHTADLSGKATAWCTFVPTIARKYLGVGDLHVFFTHDRSDKPTIPRVAIYTKDNRVREIRGVLADEEMEPGLIDTAMQYAEGLSGAERFVQHARDVQRLDEIEARNAAGEILSVADLRFLHEVDRNMKHFGTQLPDKVEAIRQTRNLVEDYARMFDCRPDQVALGQASLTEESVVLIGSYYYSTLPLPPHLKYVSENFNVSDVTTSLGELEGIGGTLSTRQSPSLVDLGELRRIGGHGIIDAPNLHSLGKLELAEKELTLGDSVRDMGSVTEVGGKLKVGKGLQRTYPVRVVGDTLIAEVIGDLDLSGIERVGGVDIFKAGTVRFGDTLDSIDHGFSIVDAEVDFGGVVWVGGDVRFIRVSDLSGNPLEFVAEKFAVHYGDMPAVDTLEYVGRDVDISDSNIASMASLAHIGGPYVRGNSSISTERLRALMTPAPEPVVAEPARDEINENHGDVFCGGGNIDRPTVVYPEAASPRSRDEQNLSGQDRDNPREER